MSLVNEKALINLDARPADGSGSASATASVQVTAFDFTQLTVTTTSDNSITVRPCAPPRPPVFNESRGVRTGAVARFRVGVP